MTGTRAAVLVAILGSLPACGTFAVEGPSPDALQDPEAATCTESFLLPALDLAGAVGSMAGAGGYLMATDREDRSVDSGLAVALGGVGAMGFGWSAQRGHERVEACRARVERAVNAARRMEAEGREPRWSPGS